MVGMPPNQIKQVQILDLAIHISRSTNTLGKCMNPIIFPPARSDWVL